jgi:hypothetical protein
MLKEIRSNKWIVLLAILVTIIFIVLETQIILLSNQTKIVSQVDSAKSKPIAKSEPVLNVLGKVKKIEGNNITLDLKTLEILAKTISGTKVYRISMEPGSAESPPKAQNMEASLFDIKVGDIISISSKEDIKNKTVVEADSIVIFPSK